MESIEINKENINNLLIGEFNRNLGNFNNLCHFYQITNEAFYGYYKKLILPLLKRGLVDKKNKILCVSSSGDNPLEYALNGFKDIDCVDINQVALFFTQLKIAGIKSLTYEEFFSFFNGDMTLRNLYDKVRNFLSGETLYFWDTVYMLIEEENIFYWSKPHIGNLFRGDAGNYDDVRQQKESYINKENYYKLKAKISDVNFNYLNLDLFDLKYINKLINDTYSVIMLSNIFDYYYFERSSFDELCDKINIINKKKKESGIFIPHYVFNDSQLRMWAKDFVRHYNEDKTKKNMFEIVKVSSFNSGSKAAVFVYKKNI